MDFTLKNKIGEGDAPPKKPKFKLNKKTIIIGGVIVIVLFVVIRNLTKSSGGTTTQVLEPYTSEYGTNSAGSAADQQAMNQMGVDLKSQMDANNETMYSAMTQLANSMQNNTDSMMQNMASQQANMYQQSLQDSETRFQSMELANTELKNSLSQSFATQPKIPTITSSLQTKKVASTTPIATVATPKTVTQFVTTTAISNATTKAQQEHNEVLRKAQAGIKLTAPTKAKTELYSAVTNSAEIIRKAQAGIKLTNPTAAATALYNQYKTK